jgi:hypothetical protein
VQVKCFDDWYEYTVSEIEERAGIVPPGEDEEENLGSGPSELPSASRPKEPVNTLQAVPQVAKSEAKKVQRSAAPPPAPVPDSAEQTQQSPESGADLAISGGMHLALQTDSSARYAVGLVFMEDKTLGFPRIFVRDVVPGGSAEQSSRLKRGDLLVLIDNEDIYGRDLDYVAAILPGGHGTFVRLGFANVDRSFIEIDLQRTTPIGARVMPSG